MASLTDANKTENSEDQEGESQDATQRAT